MPLVFRFGLHGTLQALTLRLNGTVASIMGPTAINRFAFGGIEVAGAAETDEKILDLVQHRTNGKPSCKTCPTRSYEGYSILDYHYFMGDNKAVYMSTDKLKELSENNLS